MSENGLISDGNKIEMITGDFDLFDSRIMAMILWQFAHNVDGFIGPRKADDIAACCANKQG